MLRLRRLLRSHRLFLGYSRSFSQRADIAKIHHVRFKRPWIRRLFTTCLLYGAAFHIWSSFVLLRFDEAGGDLDAPEEMDTESNKTVADGDKDDMSGEDAMFIPLGWPRMQPGEFYTPSDPEWQEFVKIASDKERLPKLRDELVSIVWRKASQSTQIGRVLGSPLTLTGSWLVHRFPYRAPPGYERSGLETSDEGISWVSKPIAPEKGDQLWKFLRPLSVTLAIRDAYLVVWRNQIERVKGFMSLRGIETAGPPTLDQPSFPTDYRTPNGEHRTAQAETRMQTEDTLREDISKDGEPIGHHSSLIISTLQRLPRPKFGPGSDLHEASMAFKWRLKESWGRDPPTPRRGVFYMSGPVGLKGPKGYCRIEVRGEYDPASRSWTAVSMQVKDLNLNNQRALGGRV